MSRQIIVIVLIAACAVLSVVSTSTESPLTRSPEVTEPREPRVPASELLSQVAEMSPGELKSLAFRELHLLKHAVLAASGQDFTTDRPWLKSYFQITQDPAVVAEDLPECERGDSLTECQVVAVCEKGCKEINLDRYEFKPGKRTASSQPSPEMITVLAKIRQAIFAKLQALSSPTELASVLDREKGAFRPLVLKKDLNETNPETVGAFSVFGRVLMDYEQMDETLLRDLMGDLSALTLIDQINRDDFQFDEAELLGLGLGDVDLLRKAILSRAGQDFEEPIKTELSALGVISPSRAKVELSPAAKQAMERLDEVVERMAKSDLDDLPGSMRAEALQSDRISLSYSGTL